MQTRDHELIDMPSAAELTNLANKIASLVSELNEARLYGFLYEALNKKKG